MIVKTIGLIILIMGFLFALYTGLDLAPKEKLLDIGSIQITKDHEGTTNWSPFIGIGVMVIGGVIFITGKKNYLNKSAK
ncbi:MAG: QVPTGV class sortase B protein-sorting domain-containing protein [Bacteroidetes bacterium]|nr:QVPTGV class sortase B protein-sorting domain-containing protein [Bacteroidota bacterium]